MLDHLPKSVRVPAYRTMQAENVRQQFLVKGLEVAATAVDKFFEGGMKKVRKYAKELHIKLI